MKAVLFPGQGSQKIGMGQELLDANEIGAEVLNRANEVFDGQLLPIMLDGPMEVLTETRWTQPAIFAHSMALWFTHKSAADSFDMTAGHSLGEYGSLVAAEVLSFEHALSLVKIRGELMHRAGETQPGTMAAILGLDDRVVENVCERISQDEHKVVPANFNSSGQIVISGHVKAVHEAMESLQNEGAKLVKELTVGGAFHSPLMKSAESELASAMEEIPFAPATMDVYSNVTASASRDPDVLRTNLLSQLTGAVRWTQTMEAITQNGQVSIVECGPGVVLQKMWKRAYPETIIESL